MAQTILIVEDSNLNMMLFCDLLEQEGYATLRADTGMKGMHLARTHHPDLILMDIKLPDVLGTDVARWIRRDSSLKNIPVIAVTALAMRGDREKIMASGFDDYISKPIDIPAFLRTIQKTIETRCMGRRPASPGDHGLVNRCDN